MFKSRVLAIAIAMFAATSAQAVTIDFEGITKTGGYSHYNNSSFSTQGFDFHLSYGAIIDGEHWVQKYYASNNGTDMLIHNHSGDLTVSAGGTLFSLGSVDAGQIWASKTTKDILVTGYMGNGKTVSQIIANKAQFEKTVFDEWNDLWKVTFSGNGYGTYDNFEVKKTPKVNAVPVPSPLLLLVSALGLVGVASRRQKTKSA